jgi:1-acyl-sn-glycerol-3-phosphate acyltransferase
MPSTTLPLATFRLWAEYFRFETEGFDILATSEPSLIVAYHGGPWTFDLWMLAARMHDELGYFPRAVWHPLWWRVPGVREAVADLGGIPGRPSDADVAEIKSRGQHLVLAPGGTREACGRSGVSAASTSAAGAATSGSRSRTISRSSRSSHPGSTRPSSG